MNIIIYGIHGKTLVSFYIYYSLLFYRGCLFIQLSLFIAESTESPMYHKLAIVRYVRIAGLLENELLLQLLLNPVNLHYNRKRNCC